MKIALDATPLTVPSSGIGEYTLQLAQHLARSFPRDNFLLLAHSSFPAVTGPANLHSLGCRTNWLSGRWWLLGLPGVLQREGVDVFHGTNYRVPFLPLLPSVLTIHDLSSIRLPELHERTTRRTARRLPWMVRAATHVVTPTQAMRAEILDEFRLPVEKVSVIPLAAGPQFSPSAPGNPAVLEKHKIKQPYVLFVGTLEPRKNLVTLVRAFARLSAELQKETQLVLCGRWGWKNEELQSEIRRLHLEEKVRATGHVPAEDLPALYRSATLLAYPSLYEGFGLPPLEAMACGVPVIAGTAPALSEVLGDAALRVDPPKVDDWRDALETLLLKPAERESYIRKGFEQAKKFSWQRTAEQTYRVYQKVLADYSPRTWARACRTVLARVPAAR